MPCENEFTVNITVLHIAHIWTTGPVVRHYHVLTLQAYHALSSAPAELIFIRVERDRI